MGAALDLVQWLDRATVPGGQGIRERYKLSTGTWRVMDRADCNVESLCAFTYAWAATGDEYWLTKAHEVWDFIGPVQDANGSWRFSSGADDWSRAHWANDGSEVTIFLLMAAELDPTNAAEYRAAAIRTTDWFLTIQDASGAFRACEVVPFLLAPMFTAQAASAIAMASQHSSTPNTYQVAVERAMSWITSRVTFDNRVLLASEAHGIEESWRPPSSDQAICVRGYAMAETYYPASTYVAEWRTQRQRILSWLTPLYDETTGAMRNGYGAGLNSADIWHITDNVYTTFFAADAYLRSGVLDDDPDLTAIGLGILSFAAGNIWYDETDPDADGCLRGAYDLTAQDFDTSEIPQNGGEEGGGDMAYTGWSAAPVAVLLFDNDVDTPPVTSARRGAAAGVFL